MASEPGRGAQVILDGDQQAAARGALAASLVGNAETKRVLEFTGDAPDGYTADGTTRSGLSPVDEVVAPFDIPSLNLVASRSSYGRNMAVLGDSISATGFNTLTPTAAYYSARGYVAWAQFYSRGRIKIDHALNFATAGWTTDNLLGRGIPSGGGSAEDRVAKLLALATKPDYCVVLAGTNDFSGGTNALSTAQATAANLVTILDRLRRGGVNPIWVPILPRTASGNNRAMHDYVNHTVRTWCRAARVFVLDAAPALIDSAGAPASGLTYDGLHPNTEGARVLGKKLWDTISGVVPIDDPLTYDALGAFSATDNPLGWLVDNPLMAGTAGSLLSGMTGSVVTGWTAQRFGGTWASGTIVGSVDAPAAGEVGSWQRVTFANYVGGANDTFQLARNRTITSADFTAGDQVTALVEVEVPAHTQGLRGLDLQISETDGSTSSVPAVYNALVPTTGEGIASGVTLVGVLRTPAVTIRPDTGQGGLRRLDFAVKAIVDGTVGGGASFAFRFRRLTVRKVPAYPLTP